MIFLLISNLHTLWCIFGWNPYTNGWEIRNLVKWFKCLNTTKLTMRRHLCRFSKHVCTRPSETYVIEYPTKGTAHKTCSFLLKCCFLVIQTFTLGGFILHIPYFSAIGFIFAMYARESANSSSVGVKTGASGGGWKLMYGLSAVSISLNPKY